MSRPRRKPVNSTLLPIPSVAAISIMRCAWSPEPATTNFTLSMCSSTFFAAWMKYSGPFCIVMRPK